MLPALNLGSVMIHMCSSLHFSRPVGLDSCRRYTCSGWDSHMKVGLTLWCEAYILEGRVDERGLSGCYACAWAAACKRSFFSYFDPSTYLPGLKE